MTAYLIVAGVLGWCLGMATAYVIGARLQARKPTVTRTVWTPQTPDAEIIAALERQIAKWKAAAHE